MSNEAKGKTRNVSIEELASMAADPANKALMSKVKISGKVLVRDKDGNPKYDNSERAGNYGEETIGDLP